MRSATACALARATSVTATVAPLRDNSSQTVAPKPWPAPVTRATFPSKSDIASFPWCRSAPETASVRRHRADVHDEIGELTEVQRARVVRPDEPALREHRDAVAEPQQLFEVGGSDE